MQLWEKEWLMLQVKQFLNWKEWERVRVHFEVWIVLQDFCRRGEGFYGIRLFCIDDLRWNWIPSCVCCRHINKPPVLSYFIVILLNRIRVALPFVFIFQQYVVTPLFGQP
jgi:hypothetical protein